MTALPCWPANWLADAAPALLSFGFLLLIEFIHNQSVGDVVLIDVACIMHGFRFQLLIYKFFKFFEEITGQASLGGTIQEITSFAVWHQGPNLACRNQFVKISEALLTGIKNLFGSINTLYLHRSHKMDQHCKQKINNRRCINFCSHVTILRSKITEHDNPYRISINFRMVRQGLTLAP